LLTEQVDIALLASPAFWLIEGDRCVGAENPTGDNITRTFDSITPAFPAPEPSPLIVGRSRAGPSCLRERDGRAAYVSATGGLFR
jgi:hypothetical protein